MPRFMELDLDTIYGKMDLDTNLGKLMDLDFLVQYIISYRFSEFRCCLWKILWS